MLYTNLVTKFHNTTDTFRCIIAYSLPHVENVDSYYFKNNKTGHISEQRCFNFLNFFSLCKLLD